ncbi:TIGR04168 family protein [Lusitaniella coriacea LEGE 07157]|uniref:TIGR04168 family protein n=1 Tax=Lusitaniella coriacea LEGE 07157 TaxID=945747 RepID=A0A8J7JA12_9CYAN|nr:TIGR04168 family protein [Lusitaniella coriacea]MBE9115965.1 TIGR04168 family protein [Lusitaniella coriacea LEGE 07157]
MENTAERSIQIAVIGDVHDQWEKEDNLALQQLGVDLALFVGDFGNESVEVVREISTLEVPFAAILGNHDAWYSASEWGRKKSPYDREIEDRVQQQLDLLGKAHVGYGKLEFPELGLSVVGGRPFSWGGSDWRNRDFYRDRYGINDFEESTARIVEVAKDAAHQTLIFLGHNGPSGLGDRAEDICGRDWGELGGDHGDLDFAGAIAQVLDLGKHIPLVTFGHMHHRLRHTREQLRTNICTTPQGTIYLNAAAVPRIIQIGGDVVRNFSLVSLQGGRVKTIDLIWIDENGTIHSSTPLYSG